MCVNKRDPVFIDIIHAGSGPAFIGSRERQVERLMIGTVRLIGFDIQVDDDIIEVVFLVMPQDKENALWRAVFDRKTEGRTEVAFPGMAGNGNGFFEQIDMRAGAEQKQAAEYKRVSDSGKRYKLQRINFGKGNQVPGTRKDQSTFSTCSFAFSSSSFICTTHFWMVESYALDPVVLISRPISCRMKDSFLPLEGSASWRIERK